MSFFRRILNVLAISKVRLEIDSELKAHLAMRIDDNVASGMSPREARRDAKLRFGNAIVIQERTIAADAALAIHSVVSDLRYACRQLRKSPGFLITAVMTLALGVGVNLAVFQLLYGVLFAHLPIDHPEQIFSLHAVESPFDSQWFFSYPAYQRLRQATTEGVPIFARSGVGGGVLQESNGASTRVDFQLVSDNFFQALHLTPAVGRFFQAGEDLRQQSEWPVILRYGFYKRHFAGRLESNKDSMLGMKAVYNGIPIVIVGVAPEGFNGINQGMTPDLWFPLAAQSTGQLGTWFDSLGPGYGLDLSKPYINQPQIFWLWVLARMPDPVKSTATAHWTSALVPDTSMMANAAKEPHRRAEILASQVKLVSASHGEGSLGKAYGQPLIILMSMAAVILLVGCLNLANLQIARLEQREKEINIRIALGASRSRVLRQIAIEAFLISAMGGALAVLTGWMSSSILLHWASRRGANIPLDLHIGLASALLGAALLMLSLAGFGLLPAWQMTRKSFSHAMKSRAGSLAAQSKAGRRWSNVLLACQVSFSLLLLSAAILFANTLKNITHIDAGIDRDHLLTAHLDMDSTGYGKQRKNFPALYRAVTQRIESIPGVRSAAVQMCDIPNCGWNTAFHVYGNPAIPEERLHGEENHVGLNYFRTLGMPLLQGRDFDATDTPKTTRAAVLSRSYAHQLFGNENPIGRWIGYNSAPDDHQFQVIGVAADARVDGLRSEAPAEAYISLEQDPQKFGTIEVRVTGEPRPTLPEEIREALHAVDPNLPVIETVPMNLDFEDGLTTEKLLARLTSVFGALTLAMAALGFYGLLSFRVMRRWSEISIRMALGATRNQVQSLFLKQTIAILCAGLIPGIALSIVLHSFAHKLLYEQGSRASTNLIPLSIAIAVLVCVALLATLLPARRAASIDPAETLRSE